MRKLLTILTISAIAMTSLLAKSAKVQLTSTIDETEVTYELSYINEVLVDGIKEYKIAVNPLTEDGKTDFFSVHATSNMNSDLAVSVKVFPDKFRTALNNGQNPYNSKITPKVTYDTEINTITAGKHTNYLVNKFYLSWKGDADLPAGDYVSDVKIKYTIK
ncbi:MAG: hypothetical protein EOL97_12550 [Spirochaetia bacterium]|nr:hypothetical protein [Spirochaetia bacterium]